jgi:hypothetical protein
MQPNKLKVSVRHLLAGDLLCTGETVATVSRGAHTPSGKVEVTLEKGGARRSALWGASTTINVVRPADAIAGKVETLGALLSDLAKVAVSPDGSAILAGHADALVSALATHQLICSACVAEPRKEGRR